MPNGHALTVQWTYCIRVIYITACEVRGYARSLQRLQRDLAALEATLG